MVWVAAKLVHNPQALALSVADPTAIPPCTAVAPRWIAGLSLLPIDFAVSAEPRCKHAPAYIVAPPLRISESTAYASWRVAGFSLPPIDFAVSAVGGYLQAVRILAIGKPVAVIIYAIITDFWQWIVIRYALLTTTHADERSRCTDSGKSRITRAIYGSLAVRVGAVR